METINGVLHFLNYSGFVGYFRRDDYSNFNCVKNVLKDYFQEVDSKQLIRTLGVIDDLRILLINQDFNAVVSLIESLRERIFTLYEKKTIEE